MVTLFDDIDAEEPAIVAEDIGRGEDDGPVAIATGEITDCGLAVLREKVEKLNKRAKRLGLEPIIINVIETRTVEKQASLTKIAIRYQLHTVEVRGIAPKVNGWRVLAKIEFSEAGNFVSGTVDVNPAWRTVPNRCDHCQTKRQRNDLIVIRHVDGREIVVGRNCLADYIRSDDAASMIAMAECFGAITETISGEAEDDEFEGAGFSRGQDYWNLQTILEASSVVVRKFGWVPKSASGFGTMSTHDIVLSLLCPPKYDRDKWQAWVDKHQLIANEHDSQEAAKARDFLASIPVNTPSDYLHNLRVLGALDYVPNNKTGLAVSIVAAARKARDEATKRAEEREARPQEFIGTIGERFKSLPVTVKRVRSTEGTYGVTTIITFTHATGELTWFASGDQCEAYPEGESFVIDATVKQHKTDSKYGNTTIVNRVKISK